MRLVHFSDIHCFAGSLSRRGFFDKRLLGFLNSKFIRSHSFDYQLLEQLSGHLAKLSPDIIICSGDLTSNGSEEELLLAQKYLLPLHDSCKADFLLVPGNHDVYVRDESLEKRRREIFLSLTRCSQNITFPCCKLSYNHVHFYLLDAAYPTPFWCSGGQVTFAMQEWFRNEMAIPRQEKEFRLSICHFPSLDRNGKIVGRRRRLRGGSVISDALEQQRLDIALCGHIHTPFIRQGKRLTSGVEISAGSLTKYGLLNVIDIDEQIGIYKQHWVSLYDDIEMKQCDTSRKLKKPFFEELEILPKVLCKQAMKND